MKLKIKLSEFEKYRVNDKSYYNHNLYKIPISINDCNYIRAITYDNHTYYEALDDVDDENEVKFYLGETFSGDEYLDISQARKDFIYT